MPAIPNFYTDTVLVASVIQKLSDYSHLCVVCVEHERYTWNIDRN